MSRRHSELRQDAAEIRFLLFLVFLFWPVHFELSLTYYTSGSSGCGPLRNLNILSLYLNTSLKIE